jgi:hypothetical protein
MEGEERGEGREKRVRRGMEGREGIGERGNAGANRHKKGSAGREEKAEYSVERKRGERRGEETITVQNFTPQYCTVGTALQCTYLL